jgi:hypothetical protein
VIRSVAIAALALSCNYGASFRDCTITCSDVTGCPSGFSCVDTFCRAAGATTACAMGGAPGNDGAIGDGTTSMPDGESCPGDLDCDGVPDGSDNCPTVANADQANEDGDRFGDVCDPCPPYVDADPVIDTDGDGVSDQCDPRPTTPGDKIVAFEGFAHGVPAGWTATGTWAPDGSGNLVVTDATALAALIAFGIASDHETISTTVTVTDAEPSIGFGVVTDRVQGSGVWCEQAISLNGGLATNYLDLLYENVSVLDTTSDGVLTSSNELTLAIRHDLTDFDCTIANGSASLDGSGAVSVPGGSAAVGLLATGKATMSFRWVMIVSNQ